jgi:hypothetical protein
LGYRATTRDLNAAAMVLKMRSVVATAIIAVTPVSIYGICLSMTLGCPARRMAANKNVQERRQSSRIRLLVWRMWRRELARSAPDRHVRDIRVKKFK